MKEFDLEGFLSKKANKDFFRSWLGDLHLDFDQDGTVYTVNRNIADHHFSWKNGRQGIGYYRV